MKDEAIQGRPKEAVHCPLGRKAEATLAIKGSRQGCAAKGTFGHFIVAVLAFSVCAYVGKT